MGRLSLTDRFTYAAIGAAMGAVVGAVLFWLLAVYSNTLGPTGFTTSGRKWIGGSALVFAAIGFFCGSSVGTAVGNTIAAIFEFERAAFYDPPLWVVALVLTIAASALWYFTR